MNFYSILPGLLFYWCLRSVRLYAGEVLKPDVLAPPSLQLEFFAEDEIVTIVPNFSLENDNPDSVLYCIGVSAPLLARNLAVVRRQAVPCWRSDCDWLGMILGNMRNMNCFDNDCRVLTGHSSPTFQPRCPCGWHWHSINGGNAGFSPRSGCPSPI